MPLSVHPFSCCLPFSVIKIGFIIKEYCCAVCTPHRSMLWPTRQLGRGMRAQTTTAIWSMSSTTFTTSTSWEKAFRSWLKVCYKNWRKAEYMYWRHIFTPSPATCSPSQSVSGFLTGLESSGWLRHIQLILECSIFAAKVREGQCLLPFFASGWFHFFLQSLCLEGVSVLVHCSDGWDRTAQTCALISLLIDPYYRTLHGFMVLHVLAEKMCMDLRYLAVL